MRRAEDLWEATREIAKARFKNPSLLDQLARWWSQKYNLPSNHELFLSRTPAEHLIEYHLDVLYAKPLEAYKTSDGEYVFTDTGDEMIDRWEAQLAAGIDPDLEEAFDEASLAWVKRVSSEYYKNKNDGTGGDTDFLSVVKRVEGIARQQDPSKFRGTFGDQ